MRPPLRVREATPSDWPFIRKGWMKTFLRVGQVMQGADPEHYHAEMSRLFARVMPISSARVACDITDEDTTIGFAVYAENTLHYLYVEKDFRRHGVADMLLDGTGIKRYTFRTLMGDRWLKSRNPGWKYTPRFTF